MRRSTALAFQARSALRLWTTIRKCSTTAQDKQYIRVEPKERALWITLNRPDLHNAFNEFVIQELYQVFTSIATDENIASKHRCVVLTGAGKSFSAGADLNWMRKMAKYTREENERDSLQLYDMFHAIRTCPLPVIGRVNGPALGGGSGLVASCDFAFAVENAMFGFTEVKLGLIPAVISPFVMEKIGARNCSRYFLTGERFDATVAEKLGLIQNPLAKTLEELDQLVQKAVSEFDNNSPQALRTCKQLIRKVEFGFDWSGGTSHEAGRKFVAGEIAAARVSPEGQEGLAAFLEKRKPKWAPSK